MPRSAVASCLGLLFSAVLSTVASAATVLPGDLLVTGYGAATGAYVAAVNRATGAAQIISSGGLIVSPWTVAAGADSFIYVGNASNIIRVEPSTGAQALFSTDLTANSVSSVSDMIVHSNGDLYYTRADGKVVRVDRTTGAQTYLVSTASTAIGITERRDQDLYVSSDIGTSPNKTVVQRVDPNTGAVTPVAIGGIGKPRGIGFDLRDSLYVEAVSDRGVYRVNLSAGTLGPLTGLDLAYQSSWMIAHPDGYLYFTHIATGGGIRIDREDPVTGAKATVSTSSVLGTSVIAISVAQIVVPTPTHSSTWGRIKSLYR
jgi:streptogramin lyase